MKLFILVLMSLISLGAYSQSAGDSLIYWGSHVKLNWADFKGEVPHAALKTDAMSYVEIKAKARWLDGVPDYNVYAAFRKYGSWTRNNTSLSLLKHEQLHFDIGELYVRKMRKAVFELNARGDTRPKDYQRILNRLADQYNETNALYDAETSHGLYKNEQEMWNREIKKELYELREYDNNL